MSDDILRSESEIQEEKIRALAKKKKKKAFVKKLFLWLIFLALVGTIVYFAVFKEAKKTRNDIFDSTPVVLEATVTKNVYTAEIDLSGYVAPNDIQNATFRTTGPVTNVYVKEGDSVTKGQKLASIDSLNSQISLLQAQNALKKAELTGTEMDVMLSKLDLERAEKNLSYTDIVANFDGVVASLSVSEGDYFEAGGKSVITVVDVSKLKATVDIDEIDMQYVKVGQKVSLTFDSLPGQVVEGYVSYIPMLGEYSSQGIGIVKVELTIDNPPQGLTPGFSFEGTISVEGDVEMLLLPSAAVTTGRGGVTTVEKKVDDGTSETVTVNVKYLGEGYVQIISGDIKEGDTVVYTKTTSNGFSGMMAMPAMGGF